MKITRPRPTHMYLGKIINKYGVSRFIQVETEDKFSAIPLLEKELLEGERLVKIYLALN